MRWRYGWVSQSAPGNRIREWNASANSASSNPYHHTDAQIAVGRPAEGIATRIGARNRDLRESPRKRQSSFDSEAKLRLCPVLR
jgi:hypothetical protein